MKRILHYICSLLLVVLAALTARAQSGKYGNEWIDYSKTYYKFKVGKNGIYHISRASLSAAGVPAGVLGSNFMLFRDGQEVPIWVSNDNMSSSDYIEFAGRKGDGMLDKELYAFTSFHPDDRISMFTDTACYYLTYDNGSSHVRYAQAANTIPANPPAPETWCWSTVGNYFRDAFTPGRTFSSNEGYYSSLFDDGEGLVNALMGISPSSQFLAAPNAALAAPVSAMLHTAVTTISYSNAHEMKLFFNNQQVADSTFGISQTKKFDIAIPANQLAANNEIRYSPQSIGSGAYDLYGVSFAELQYPRNYDVAGLEYFPFRLNASSSPQYIEFLNFGNAGNRLFDVTNRQWYTGDVSISGKTRFYLQPSLTARELILFAAVSSSIPALTPVKTIHFTDYSNVSNQGDYVIISHSALINANSAIQDYKAYRSSAAGGQYKPVIADVNELYDEFAYGYDIHPLSIRHFLNYAYDTWTVKPDYAYLIGRGILYHEYAQYRSNPSQFSFPIVPTYGHPGSDADFANFYPGDNLKIRIGRLSVWNASEISTYLDKIKGFEAALKTPANPTAASESWKKQVLHVAGSTDLTLQNGTLLPSLFIGEQIIRDTFTGYNVTTIAKSSSNYIDLVNLQIVDSLLRNGLSMITFYGHASPTLFDYNLPAPGSYTAAGSHLPFFLALGCDVAQMFDLSTQKTIAERYVLTPNSGSTAMIAADNISFTNFDNIYMFAFYASIAKSDYGATLGRQYQAAYDSLMKSNPGNLVDLQSLLFVGDPALHLYAPAKPDYSIGNSDLAAIPGNVTTSMDSFRLRIISHNLGKAIADTVQVKIEHINPANTTSTVTTVSIPNLYSLDTSYVSVPINKLADLGLNKYKVTIDAAGQYDELSETNNTGVLDLFIYSDNLVPVYPKDFSIVYQQGVTLKASTLNPFRPTGRYRLEIDTTELFNSPLKLQTTISSPGGVIKWTPALQLRDSTVYYWRTAFDSVLNGSYQWSGSSFIYLAGGSPGWNQSHYFQYGHDNITGMQLDNSRRFSYIKAQNVLEVRNSVIYVDGDGDYSRIYLGSDRIQSSSQDFTGIQIMAIDTSGQFWMNDAAHTYGSFPPWSNVKGYYVREFLTYTAAQREAAAHFLDTIPNNYFVMVKNVYWDPVNYPGHTAPIYAADWRADSALYNGHSLYHSLRNLGFNQVDSFNRERAFIFMRRKGDPTFPVYQAFTDTPGQHLIAFYNFDSYGLSGQLESTVIGPAKKWTSLHWRTHSNDTAVQNDTSRVLVYGLDSTQAPNLLFTAAPGDTSLAFIDAKLYPNIRLVWTSYDSVTRTSPQLNYWRVIYSPVPEAALNPAAYFVFSDSLQVGQQEAFSVAIENLTELPMDSMLVRYKIIDASGVTRLLPSKRYRPLPGNDTLHADYSFDPRGYPGRNIFFVEANPDNDQPEQYHPNNLGYLPFHIEVDKYNPLLDVTFDGVHILDGDIVSGKPVIRIMLKDENKHLQLDDTGLVKVGLHYPSDPIGYTRPVAFDGTTCRFIPAQANTAGKNEAFVEFRPVLDSSGTYELVVTGRDKTGNIAGKNQYQISFEVENKPTVTNVLNYPNPFSTSTAFLFTITGSQIPSQFKIQILSVTGRVVKEITREELGPLHIGRNITEYKWDGRDQYGQLLGNGVYMYRVVTSLNGNEIEHRVETGVDKFFKNGYGKMYIMR